VSIAGDRRARCSETQVFAVPARPGAAAPGRCERGHGDLDQPAVADVLGVITVPATSPPSTYCVTAQERAAAGGAAAVGRRQRSVRRSKSARRAGRIASGPVPCRISQLLMHVPAEAQGLTSSGVPGRGVPGSTLSRRRAASPARRSSRSASAGAASDRASEPGEQVERPSSVPAGRAVDPRSGLAGAKCSMPRPPPVRIGELGSRGSTRAGVPASHAGCRRPGRIPCGAEPRVSRTGSVAASRRRPASPGESGSTHELCSHQARSRPAGGMR